MLQLDQAGAHIATQLQWPAKVTPVFQPPASPERGPMELLVAGAQGAVPGTQLRDAATPAAVAVPSAQSSLGTDHPLAHQLEVHPPSGSLR
ncbi:MAG: hypothetical protein BRC51_14295 [Cyanobacteria bacterium SW_12_48_29]|nr:MAG: hypothetical protein BRC51_14295 [Cyanobacteria bacterium SW_12_48_29]